MENLYPIRNIICIDLKSFFASCECIDRNLDPFKTPLVVADPNRGSGAVTLAITPYLKSKGIKSRCRIYEIPKNIKYILAKPRMSLYIKKSYEVNSIYLDFVSKEDIHIYSIDEVFIDVTEYLSFYKKTDYELALTILDAIHKKTGLTASCGIGPNMLLAKIAMDTEAKNSEYFISKWTYEDIPNKLWTIKPLSKFWGIGYNMEKRLNKLGIYSIYDLAHYEINKLKEKLGVMGNELWYHANGIDLSRVKDVSLPPKEKSFNHSQILFKDYFKHNINIIIIEMIEVLCSRLRHNNVQARIIGFGIGYSKKIGGGFYHSIKLDTPIDDSHEIMNICNMMFNKYYKSNLPIRKISLSFGNLIDKKFIQLSLFDKIENIEKKDKINHTLDYLKDKYGKDSILHASSLLSDSTIKERNKK